MISIELSHCFETFRSVTASIQYGGLRKSVEKFMTRDAHTQTLFAMQVKSWNCPAEVRLATFPGNSTERSIRFDSAGLGFENEAK
jgi:hypothetical protein